MIYGIGTDIVELARLEGALRRHPERFAARAFTDAERARAGELRNPVPYYAGRWAAKEAIVKALGVGFGADCGWHDIEVLGDELGKPLATLSGPAAAFAREQGIAAIHVSISHEAHYAVAMAVAERKPDA